MATLLWQRDIGSDINGVKNTYSSWDACMTKAYCKWPAIIGIILGSLILLSILWCAFRCLCCGMECCCGCLSCCNSCCPSPRRKQRNDGYYQQPPPPPPQPPYQPYPQYQSPAPPQYAGGGYRGQVAQTATFDAPSKTHAGAAKYNEDALPAMPSWHQATSKHVEEEDDVELEKLDHYPKAQQEQSLLSRQEDNTRYYSPPNAADAAAAAGDMGAMHASPYHDYDQHQQFVGSPTSTARNSAYPPTYRTSPTSTMYEPQQRQWGSGAAGGGYAESVAPSYHTNAPTYHMEAAGGQQGPGVGIGRKPVQGTWRDV